VFQACPQVQDQRSSFEATSRTGHRMGGPAVSRLLSRAGSRSITGAVVQMQARYGAMIHARLGDDMSERSGPTIAPVTAERHTTRDSEVIR